MSASTKQLLRGGLVLAALAALACGGHWLLFTHFMVYDDEGYVLWTLRTYAAEGALYTKVYSQYGPLFYAAYDAVHRLTGLEFNNTMARWITLGFWLATAGLGGALAARVTRSTAAGFAAAALTFAALSVMSSEPIHPGGPLAFLSALGVWAGAQALRAGKPGPFVLGTAAVGAAMFAIKINTGVFFLVAAGSWVALHTRLEAPRRRALEWLVLLGACFSPVLLMRERLAEPGYAQFALVFSAGAAGLALLLRRGPRETEHVPRDWAVFAAVAAGVVIAAMLAVIARGTTAADLWQGMFVAPLNQPLAYSSPPRWQPAASALALASLGLAAWALTRREQPAWWPPAVAVLRLGGLGAAAWAGWHAEEHAVGRVLFHFGPSLAWLFALPLQSDEPRVTALRAWLGWVFVWQTLHAFPVAGSQVAWGSLLGAPLLVIGAHEAVAVLAGGRAWMARITAAILLAASLPAVVQLLRTGWLYRSASTELGLPGAEQLRVPANIANSLRAMSRNAQLHGGLLFSHPGMFSLNLWSGRPTPTAANVTLWSTLLTSAQQEEIRARLAADPRAVIVGQEYVLNYLIAQGFAPHGPLNDHLVRHFAPAFRVDTYVFWVQRGRTIAPVGTARLQADADGNWTIELITDAAGGPASWEIWTNGPVRRLRAGEFSAATVRRETLSPEGRATTDPTLLGNSALDGQLVRLTWRIAGGALPGVDDLELRVLDADGRAIERVPFRR